MGICKTCGKIFYSKNLNKDYCSKDCRKIAAEIKRKENDQPCWDCKNACGGCDWSENFTPINGWDAEPIILKDKEGSIRTYKIKYCPQYHFEKHGGYCMFKEILKKERKSRKLSQEELAEKLKLTKSAISNYECGLRQPDNKIIIKIANFFGRSVDYMLGLDEETPSKTVVLDDISFAMHSEFSQMNDEEKQEILRLARMINNKK